MKRILTSMCLAAMMLVAATAANAGTIDIVGGTPGFIPGGAPASNNFLGAGNLLDPLATVQGFYGANIFYNVVGIGSVTIDFFGAEAGFHNQFLYSTDGGTTYIMPNAGFDHAPGTLIAGSVATPLATASYALPSGLGMLLNFAYSVNGVTGGPTGGPINGANVLNTPGLPPNFFSACGPLAEKDSIVPATCDTVWIFLDDNGASNDDNHDDYLVRITVNDRPREVPEPASFALIGSGLLGLGLIARKFRK